MFAAGGDVAHEAGLHAPGAGPRDLGFDEAATQVEFALDEDKFILRCASAPFALVFLFHEDFHRHAQEFGIDLGADFLLQLLHVAPQARLKDPQQYSKLFQLFWLQHFLCPGNSPRREARAA